MERRSSKASEFRATDVEGSPQIEAYFAVFNDIYEMYPGGTESIDPHALEFVDGKSTPKVQAMRDIDECHRK